MRNLFISYRSFFLILAFLGVLPVLKAEEKTFFFGQPPFAEKAVVTEQDSQYIVTCFFRPRRSSLPKEQQDSFNLQRAKGICIKGIASYRRGESVSRVSGNVRGMMEIKDHELKNGELIYYFQVASFVDESN